MLGCNTPDRDRTLGHGGSYCPGSSNNAVGDNSVFHGSQGFNAVNGQGGCTNTFDHGTHCNQHVTDVRNLRFSGDILDHGFTPCRDRGHDECLRCAHTGKLQNNVSTV